MKTEISDELSTQPWSVEAESRLFLPGGPGCDERMNHTITALTLQKRNRQRVNVFLDGEFAFGLARIVAAWLQVGLEINDEKVAQLRAEDAREVAYQFALKLLNFRARSEVEIRQNLAKHQVSECDIELVVEKLKENGLINDQRFVQGWVENRNEFRPRGKRALSYELQRLGIDHQEIDKSLEDLDEEELAYQAGSRAIRTWRELDQQEFRKKLYGHLARRGFSYEVISPVIARLWAEQHDNSHKDELFSNDEVDYEG